MSYATPLDLAAWLDDVAPDGSVRLLARASTLIDKALIGAVYSVDVSSNPTDPNVIQAFNDATCAQVEFWLATQDEVGQFDNDYIVNASVAGISRQRTPGRRARLCPRAYEILQLAQLLPVKSNSALFA